MAGTSPAMTGEYERDSVIPGRSAAEGKGIHNAAPVSKSLPGLRPPGMTRRVACPLSRAGEGQG
jgi:hypothetical protein